MYKLLKLSYGQTVTNCVHRIQDNIYIPFDPANTDYQEYLKWLAEGNEPLPPDEDITN
jgi:hypothetical protein